MGECRPAKHAPDAESGKRVTGAGTHTESGEGKEEGEVHRALPPYQHRPARTVVLRTQGGRCTRRGSADVEGLRGRPRAQAEDLHDRVQRGAYRAMPNRRVYISKPDGRQRPLADAALEDTIVPRAGVTLL